MQGLNLRSRSIRAAALGVMSVAALAIAQPEPVIEFRSAGFTAVEPIEKDALAHAAFLRLGDRIDELGQELDMEAAQQAGLGLLWDLMMSGMAMRVDLGEEGPGLSLAISPIANGGAAGLAESLGRFLTEAGLPLEVDSDGATVFPTPMGPARISLQDAEAGTYTLITAGSSGGVEPGVGHEGLPEGATAVMSGMIDLEGLGAFVLPMMAQEDEEAAKMFGESGWLGEGAPTLTFSVGVDEDEMYSNFRATNARAAYMGIGGSSQTLTVSDFRVVPADATVVSGFTLSLTKIIEWADQAAKEAGEDPFGEVSEVLGVDVKSDVLLNMGPRMVYYQADSTGGGGMLSGVMLGELRDAEAFGAAHGRIAEFINGAAAEEAEGYVKVRSWSMGDGEVFSLTFPGLPIPLEPSWCIRGDWVVAAASPAGLSAALAQLENSETSVLNREEFAQGVVERWPDGGPVAVSFMDSARMARKGYGLTNLMTSALANAARSPSSPDRVNGPLMPPFAEFTAGIKPYVEMGYWEGDDLVFSSVGDRSGLVQIAAAVGAMTEMQGLAIPALAGGVLLPALGKARESAQSVQSMTQVRNAIQGLILYGAANDEELPASIGVLVEEGFFSEELLESPYGPAHDGGPSIALRINITKEQAYWYDSNVILAVDRSMLLAGEYMIVVGFGDNHVDLISIDELYEMLELPVNEGAREELQIP